MGDVNQLNWVHKNRDLIRGPVIEVGSRHYTSNSSVDYRGLCKGLEFVGVDLSQGDNVDVVIDFTADLKTIRAQLGERSFRTVICCSVLEHVEDVFTMARNMSAIVEPGGVMFLSAPFTWRFHGYPSDYWRFTPKALRFLFPDFEFRDDLSTISSNMPGDMRDLADDPNPFVVRPAEELKSRYRFLGRFGMFNRLRVATSLDNYHYMLAPSCINMVGFKTAA